MKRTSILDLLDDESQWKRTNKDIEEDENLTPAQRVLLRKIRTEFNPNESTIDQCILHKVADYEDFSEDSFWKNHYQDFVKVYQQEALVRLDSIRKSDLLGKKIQETWNESKRYADMGIDGVKRYSVMGMDGVKSMISDEISIKNRVSRVSSIFKKQRKETSNDTIANHAIQEEREITSESSDEAQ